MIRSSVGVAFAALCLAACSPKEDVSTPVGPAQPGMGAATLDDFKSELPVKDVMKHVIDYNAFGVWNQQGWLIDKDGVHELFPTDEATWLGTISAAQTLAEASNLLLLPGRPQDDDRRWVDYAHALYDAAIKTRDAAARAEEAFDKNDAAVLAKEKEKFFDAGGEIYEACLQCHNHYIVGEPGPQSVLPPLPNRVKPEDAAKAAGEKPAGDKPK